MDIIFIPQLREAIWPWGRRTWSCFREATDLCVSSVLYSHEMIPSISLNTLYRQNVQDSTLGNLSELKTLGHTLEKLICWQVPVHKMGFNARGQAPSAALGRNPSLTEDSLLGTLPYGSLYSRRLRNMENERSDTALTPAADGCMKMKSKGGNSTPQTRRR